MDYHFRAREDCDDEKGLRSVPGSSVGGIDVSGRNQLIVVRDIPAGDVIQESDLQPLGSAEPFRPESWGWAKVSDRPKVIGHKAKNMIGTGSRFHMSEIEP